MKIKRILFIDDGPITQRDLLFLAVISKDNNQHIGNIKLGPINRLHKTAGFKEGETRKGQYLCEGRYVDGILFGKINPYERVTC